ncbi:MAG: ABC transporter permease, partial [Butyrivibrio sp.]|nr:ABC transporter permease [Butyrivibrio sp.]
MKLKHKGRLAQTFIYFGKLIRMFIFQNDWKVLPMAAVIAGLVAYVTGSNLFKNMEGTLMGSFALACVCIWNGFFNSIQVICRERAIIKREHRAGLHITSYVASHMLYQALLCIAQAMITITVYRIVGTVFPTTGILSSSFTLEFAITLFLITYAADMMALMVSAIARTTTAAMTVMPFLLIVQLVFSGGIFHLSGPVAELQDIMISKWGIQSLCIEGNYNSLPMVSVWNNLFKMKNVEIIPGYKVYDVLKTIEDEGKRDDIL